MPKYLDHHAAVNLPPAVAQQVVAAIKAKTKDKHGVVHLNAFMGKSDAWCLSEAPNADAVCKAHEEVGLKLDKGNVVEVQSMV